MTKVLIIVAPYYRHIADMLINGAEEVLAGAGARSEVIEVPGALEIPPAIRFAADAGRYEGFVALGCVIRGETTHYETVCNDSSHGLMLLGVQSGLVIGNGILTVENEAQALRRADPAQLNKGAEAARACLALINLKRRFPPPRRTAPEGSILLAGNADDGGSFA